MLQRCVSVALSLTRLLLGMQSDCFAHFSSPAFDIALLAMSTDRASPFVPDRSCPASSTSLSSFPRSPPSKSLHPALSVRIPNTLVAAAATPASHLSLPSLPLRLTEPAQLRLFWPHHWFGHDVDAAAAPVFNEWRQRRFFLAATRAAARRQRRCLHCNWDPATFPLAASPSTPPLRSRGGPEGGEEELRVSTPPVDGSPAVGFVECPHAPRKPRYSLHFLLQLDREEQAARQRETERRSGSRQGKRQRNCSDDERLAVDSDQAGETDRRKRRPAASSWQAEDVASSWAALPPPAPTLTLPSRRASFSSSAASVTAAARTPPLSPVSCLSRSLSERLRVGRRRDDDRAPAAFMRLTDSPFFRPRRRLLPPVPVLTAEQR